MLLLSITGGKEIASVFEHKAELFHGPHFHFFTQWVPSSHPGIALTGVSSGLLIPLLPFPTLLQNCSQNTLKEQ